MTSECQWWVRSRITIRNRRQIRANRPANSARWKPVLLSQPESWGVTSSLGLILPKLGRVLKLALPSLRKVAEFSPNSASWLGCNPLSVHIDAALRKEVVAY